MFQIRETSAMELKEKLQSEIDKTNWELLNIHHDNQAVLIVDSSLELLEVGLALAEDQFDRVKSWHEKKLIWRPTESEVKPWKENPQVLFAHFLIVRPFVLIVPFDTKA